jgi:ferredoxin-NADP reductase
MHVTLVNRELVAKNIITFRFKPERPMRYIAGQFTELTLPHAGLDARGNRRWFTLSSAPTEELLAITTKFADLRESSFKRTMKELKAGTSIDMALPMGDFVLPKDPSIPLLFVAGGIGATPFRSIIKFLQDSNEQRDITLLYAANPAELAFREIFDKLGKNFITTDHVNLENITENILDPLLQHVYISGPESMVDKLSKGLAETGFPKNHIRSDFFHGYAAI